MVEDFVTENSWSSYTRKMKSRSLKHYKKHRSFAFKKHFLKRKMKLLGVQVNGMDRLYFLAAQSIPEVYVY